jgi:hypothetical protein
MPSSNAPHSPIASLVWFDPGETTGVAVLSIDPRWLAGNGPADWEGLGRAVKTRWFAEIGAEPRWWDGRGSHADEIALELPERIACGPEISRPAAIELSQIYQARAILDDWPKAAWGYEDYHPESMAGAQKVALSPMRFFSTLAFGAIMDDDRPRVPFVQNRSMKFSASDSRLQSAKLYAPGMKHATDAARHAAIFFRAARKELAVRSLAWPKLFAQEAKTA